MFAPFRVRHPITIAAVLGFGLTGGAAADGESAQITARADRLGAGEIRAVAGAPIVAGDFIVAFYEGRDARPAWVGTPAVEALLAGIDLAVGQGYRPEDFHMPRLADLLAAAEAGGAPEIADFEIVATDAAARLVHHLQFGKVDPEALHPDRDFGRPVLGRDPVAAFDNYLDGEGFSALIERLTIDDPQYLDLVEALAFYREIDDGGGWPDVPAGAVLNPGAEDARVPLLRGRLAFEDGAVDANATGTLYDGPLVAAVERFQRRHGLVPDGAVGPQTLAALNRSAAESADMLRLSLERFRPHLRGLGADYAILNIAGARLFAVLGGDLAWATRAATGAACRVTPVFRDEIEYMVFNPSWYVPGSIFRAEMLPAIRRDPSYLDSHRYMIRNADGQAVAASSVDWTAENPDVSLVQLSGPDNALGRVKFVLPNGYALYLQDSNDHGLFDRKEGEIESGCVIVEDPFVFAGLLMREDPTWTQARMQAILDTGETTRIDLPRPMPLLVTYWTAWVEDGAVHFRDDPDGRDAAMLAALDADF